MGSGDDSSKANDSKDTKSKNSDTGSEPHIQGSFFIENFNTHRRFTSWIPSNFTETPLFLWPLLFFDPNLIYGHFDVEYTGKKQEYYIRNTPFGASAPLYITHNAPSAPTLAVQQQTCRLIPTSFPDTYFISTEPSNKDSPGVLTDQHAAVDFTGDLRPDVERLDKTDTRQMWVFKRL